MRVLILFPPPSMRRFLRPASFLALFAMLFTFFPPPKQAYAALDTDPARKVEIVIQSSKIDATLTDFPVLLTEDNLPSEPCDADGTYPAQDGGGDIRFSSDADGNDQLPLEIVTFTTDNNPANCEVEMYVKVPAVSSSTGTSIWMWYNTSGTDSQPSASATYGSENVWNSNYSAVWHFEESSGTRYDSTGNDNDLSDVNTVTSATGQIGTAASFDPTNSEYLYINDTGTLSMGSDADLYMSAWVNMDDTSAYRTIAGKYYATNGGREYVLTYAPSATDKFYTQTVYNYDGDNDGQLQATSFGAASTGTWYHVGLRFDASGDALEIAIDNGTKDSLSTSDIYNGTARFTVGSNNTEATAIDFMDGKIDELRFMKYDATDAWWKAEYENTSSPSTFAVEGSPEDAAVVASASTVIKSSDESVSSSTTLQNDDDFVFALEANKEYIVSGGVFATSTSGQPDIKIAFTTPAGSTMGIGYLADVDQTRRADLIDTSGSATSSIPIKQNQSTIIQVIGSVTTGGTAGNLTFQWAQNTSNASATKVQAGSFITVTEVNEE